MRLTLLRAFWDCGDSQIIEFALIRARLNRIEKQVVCMVLDECLTQEEIAERTNYSVRRIQQIWLAGANKLLNIPWVAAYAKELSKNPL